MSVKHSFTSAKSDGGDPTLVRPSNWNADHTGDTSRSATKIVAASDAAQASKDGADYTCDGTADNVEINTAITSLPTNGGTVALSEGTFTVNAAAISLKTGLRLVGQGESTIIKLVNSGNGRLISSTATLSDIMLEKIVFDGNGANQSDDPTTPTPLRDERCILFLSNITNLKVLNCVIRNCRHGAALRLDVCNHALVQGNRFITNGISSSVLCDHSFISNSDHYRVVGNSYLTCTDTGTAQDGVQHSTVTGNTYEDCQGNAVTVSNSSTRVSKYNTVCANVVKGGGTTSAGIKVSDFGNAVGSIESVVINGNVIQGCDRAMWLEHVNRLVVTGNILSEAAGSNKQLMLLGTGTPAMNDLEIASNMFYNTTNRGISFDVAANIVNAKVHDNSFITVTTPIGGTLPASAQISRNRGYVTENSGTSTGTGSQQSIAHGLAATPNRIYLSDIEQGANAYQSAAADATNIYITAVVNQDYVWRAEVV